MRYIYTWNEFDCEEVVLDAQSNTKIIGCEQCVKEMNELAREVEFLRKETFRLGKALEYECALTSKLIKDKESK